MAQESGSGAVNRNYAQPSTSKRSFNQNTPHSEKREACSSGRKRSRMNEYYGDSWVPNEARETPLPFLRWANSKDVWQMMVYREEATNHNRTCRLFEDPANCLPRMRAILIDWIMEVCEAYHLTRTTYHLSVDYIDRYLSNNPTVPKNQLQLIGITALFIAAKFEEIYPPKLCEFSYVCDGACSSEDIINCEVLLLTCLDWDLNFMTPTGWLNLYMQIHWMNQQTEKDPNFNFMFPQYPPYAFIRASNLIDLFTLDPGYLLFSYSVIAAAAMYFIHGRAVAMQVSGYQWNNLKHCIDFMCVHYRVLGDINDPRLESIVHYSPDSRQLAIFEALKTAVPNLTMSEGYTIQSHLVNMQNLEDAAKLRVQLMGFWVRKFYIPVPLPNEEADNSPQEDASPHDKEEQSDKDDMNLQENEPKNQKQDAGNSENDQNSDTAEGQSTTRLALMFEVKNISILNKENNDSFYTEYFTDHSTYNFDEVLYGIYLYTKRRIARPVSSEET